MKLSGTVGAVKKGEIRRVWTRMVGEGPGVYLYGSGGYICVTGREARVDIGSHRKRNVTGTTERSRVVPINN